MEDKQEIEEIEETKVQDNSEISNKMSGAIKFLVILICLIVIIVLFALGNIIAGFTVIFMSMGLIIGLFSSKPKTYEIKQIPSNTDGDSNIIQPRVSHLACSMIVFVYLLYLAYEAYRACGFNGCTEGGSGFSLFLVLVLPLTVLALIVQTISFIISLAEVIKCIGQKRMKVFLALNVLNIVFTVMLLLSKILYESNHAPMLYFWEILK